MRSCPLLATLALSLPLAGRAAAGGLLVADGGFGGVLEIASHEVRVTVNNGIAVTEIDQVFRNTERRAVEALYTFPVPRNASVADFSMWIDGREMTGEVVERERAREIYESYKQTRVDPGLLEQVDAKRFEMRIFPIGPEAEQRVRVTYYQELDVDDDWVTFVYPLATTTRGAADERVQGRFALSLEAKSEVPILSVESPSHASEMALVEHAPGYWQASLEFSGGSLARDVVVAWRLERPRTGFDLVATRAKGEDGYFQLSLTAGPELAELEHGMDYVFVSDVSGSMANDGKLGLSVRSIRSFVDQLGPEDRFELLSFNVGVKTLFDRLAAVDGPARDRAERFLIDQRAAGGTVLRPAIECAYRYRDGDRPLNVVVLSDGMTEQGEHAELLRAISARPAGVRVFCIGIGNDVNQPLLRQIAEDAGGLAAFVSRGDDFERQAKAFRRKLVRPAMSDVEIVLEGGDTYDVEPRSLPDLFHGSPLRLYGRYRNAGPVTAVLRADVLGQPFEQRVELELPALEPENVELERMWAWHRVEALTDAERRDGSSAKLRDEIVRLCEGWSIASEHASFLVLENDAEFKRWQIARTNATRVLRDRDARVALRRELDGLRSKSARGVGPVEPLDPSKKSAASERVATAPPAPPAVERERPGDIELFPFRGVRRGGGALDPLGALLGLGLVALALGARRRV